MVRCLLQRTEISLPLDSLFSSPLLLFPPPPPYPAPPRPSCVCLLSPTREPSATAHRCQCRHVVAIGLELHFRQLIARNGHKGVHVQMLCTSPHPSVMHTRVRMWMHAELSIHRQHTYMTHALYPCIYAYTSSFDICACAKSRICIHVHALSSRKKQVLCVVIAIITTSPRMIRHSRCTKGK